MAEEVQGRMAFRLSYEPVADDAPAGPGHKIVHFVRHGEGRHNVAQRQWRASPLWDGHSEPYTLDTDPTGRYIDAELTVRGVQQAVALRARTARLCPDLLIVSPMRRATQTALLAFAPHVAACAMPIIAHELAHETAGRHTCDRRLSRTALATAFPAVSYSEVRTAAAAQGKRTPRKRILWGGKECYGETNSGEMNAMGKGILRGKEYMGKGKLQ